MQGALARCAAAALVWAPIALAADAGPDRETSTRGVSAGEIQGLIAKLQAPDAAARVWAADALAKLGPGGRSAVPALLRAVRKPPTRIPGGGGAHSASVAAARALWSIQPKAVVGVLEGDHRQSILNAVAALGGTRGPRVVKALQLAMLDHCDEVRLAATRALGRAGAAGGQVLPAGALRRLANATEDGNPRVRGAAVGALARLAGNRGVAPLTEVLRGGSYRDARLGAMRALASRPGPQRARVLRAAAADKDNRLAAAARALIKRPPVGGVIDARTLSAAKHLRPLSTVQVHTPARPAASRPAAGARVGTADGDKARSRDAVFQEAMVQMAKMGIGPGTAGGRQSAGPARPADAAQPAGLEKLLFDPAVRTLAKQLMGRQPSAPPTEAARGPRQRAKAAQPARQLKGAPAAAPSGDWEALLREAMGAGRPATCPQRGRRAEPSTWQQLLLAATKGSGSPKPCPKKARK